MEGWLSGRPLQRILRCAVFIVAAAALVACALPHGSYDIVARQTIGALAWFTVLVGIAIGVLPRRRPGTAGLLVLGSLGAVAAWTALGLLWTESAERTNAELARTLSYAGVLAVGLCVLSRSTWRTAAAGLVSGATIVSALAVASRLWPGAFPVDDLGGLFDGSRLAFPLGYWNALGAWGAMSTVMALAWSAHARESGVRAAALAVVPLCALATYLSYSRAAAAALLVGTVVAIALSANRVTLAVHTLVAAGATAVVIVVARHNPSIALAERSDGAGSIVWTLLVAGSACALAVVALRRAGLDGIQLSTRRMVGLLASGAAVTALAAATAGPALSHDAWRAFNSGRVTAGDDPGARLLTLGGARDEIWGAALDAFQAKPFTGTGAGTFELWWNRHPRDTQFLRDAHSLWFDALAEQGLPGAGLLATCFVVAFLALARARRRLVDAHGTGANAACIGALAAFVVVASTDWMWESTAVTVLAIAVTGAAAAPLAGNRVHVGKVWRLGLVLAALVPLAVQMPGIVSTLRVRESSDAAAAGSLADAVTLASAGIAAQPWAVTPYIQRSLALEADGALEAAAADLQRAIRREPTNWQPWMLLARVDAERDRPLSAVAAFRQARRLRPFAAAVLLAPPLRPHSARPGR